MKTIWFLGACGVALAACTSTNGNRCTEGDAPATTVVAGAGGAPQTAGGGAAGTAPRRIALGFGAYAPACGSPNVYSHQGDSNVDLGHVATQIVTVPFPGTVVRATVVHTVTGGTCDSSPRDVLVSEPFKAESPSSPGLLARLTFGAADVLSAPVYEMPGVAVGRSRALGRDLPVPRHVEEGERVALGSVLAPLGACVTGCEKRLDGNKPPAGSTDCADGQAWADCVVPDFYIAYIGWIDVVPDE